LLAWPIVSFGRLVAIRNSSLIGRLEITPALLTSPCLSNHFSGEDHARRNDSVEISKNLKNQKPSFEKKVMQLATP